MPEFEATPGNVLAIISNAQTDFRTTTSLAMEFGTTREEMVSILDGLWQNRKIRHPLGWERHTTSGRNEANWWRYPNKGLTRAEKWRYIKAVVAMESLSNGFPQASEGSVDA